MISSRPFGAVDGAPVTCFRLENASGAWAEVLDYGCILRAVAVPDRIGALRDVCLGFDTVEDYRTYHQGYLGALVGRCANRIRDARFVLNGRQYVLAANEVPNHLHGGVRGFDQYVWDHSVEGDTVVFSRTSPDGEEGYPGTLEVRVSYTLTEDNVLRLILEGESDADTVVNLTSHAYWNLNGHGAGSVGSHTLSVDAIAFTELGTDNCPNGTIASVVGTPFDLRTARPL